MIYIVLAIISISIVSFMIKGCSYPTSYRAFIPKALDSEYKEYQRLCKEEIGKVVYARPVGDVQQKMFLLAADIKLNDVIKITLGAVKGRDGNFTICI
ncbi:hypothetical protein [Helicobacter sp. UBA3407]|uniref:hypothetical protein n=1 Tax=Helicobacter sp. UBA3407 TaxID=1946588 RepID=UPI002622B460|nr:hypothetical protein [Helicobacter sp. UBA3407]